MDIPSLFLFVTDAYLQVYSQSLYISITSSASTKIMCQRAVDGWMNVSRTIICLHGQFRVIYIPQL